jgi:hypothetical protein
MPSSEIRSSLVGGFGRAVDEKRPRWLCLGRFRLEEVAVAMAGHAVFWLVQDLLL